MNESNKDQSANASEQVIPYGGRGWPPAPPKPTAKEWTVAIACILAALTVAISTVILIRHLIHITRP